MVKLDLLSTGSNSPRLPSISSIPMGGQDLSVQMPSIRPVNSTPSLYQAAETSGWSTPTDGSSIWTTFLYLNKV